MDVDFARERRWILAALILALTAGFLPIIVGTWLAATRAAEDCPAPMELGAIGASLSFGAMSCLAIVALAVIVINRYHRKLVRAATRDHVTGAFNRQAFEVMAADAISTAVRMGQPLSVVMFDVDDFKRYNDTHGHTAGDAALAAVVAAGASVVRRSDAVSRWGGDEFVILLPSCNATVATRIAGSLAGAVAGMELTAASIPEGVTISTGIAQLLPGDQPADVVARADANMYENRRAHRVAQPNQPRTSS